MIYQLNTKTKNNHWKKREKTKQAAICQAFEKNDEVKNECEQKRTSESTK